MPSPFATATADAVKALIRVSEDAADNRALYDGDHWGMDGKYYIGPRPPDPNELLTLKKALVSKNVVREVTNRKRNAIVGYEVAWSLTPDRALPGAATDPNDPNAPQPITPEEQARIDEAEAALTQWVDDRQFASLLRDTVTTLLLSGRAPMRAYIPAGLMQERADGSVIVPPQRSLADAVQLVYATPLPTLHSATVITDSDTRRECGVFVYERDEQEYVDLVYLEDDGRTTIRTIGPQGDTFAGPYDFGGRLTMHELRDTIFITPQIRQQQMLVNLALTLLGRNAVQGGQIERWLFNANLPTEEVTLADGTKKRIPLAIQTGAGRLNAMEGIPQYDTAGNVTGYATPSLQRLNPAPVDTFTATKSEAYTAILEETAQLFALMSADATASGESRLQARADFRTSLEDTASEVERAVRWLLETVLAMGATFANQAARFQGLRCVARCRLNTGPLTATEMDAAIKLHDAGAIDIEELMNRVGVDDVDAMLTKVRAEKEQNQTSSTAQATTMLARAGLLRQNTQATQIAQEATNGQQQAA